MSQIKAQLRVCASCQWIFDRKDASACPQCGFAHYGARMVFGDRAYRYAKTQKPWKDALMEKRSRELDAVILKAEVKK